MPVLSEQEVQKALQALPSWNKGGSVIKRQFEFLDFKQAMAFVNQVAEAAERANHHPDIIISYNKVTMALTSHDSGGVTHRDIRLAGEISRIFGEKK
jgi:4a-hydroxytetrahydrobiopterin dehydratase